MRIARNPTTGRFLKGNRGGPGRPPAGEMTKAELKRQRAVIAAWRAQAREGVDLIAHMHATMFGPQCGHCRKPLALTAWRARRAFCSKGCADAADERRLKGQRRRNARSKLKRGLKPSPGEPCALEETM
jgi:endogenous inhibitor of DNA gyrase (YacG/DUF329 family)